MHGYCFFVCSYVRTVVLPIPWQNGIFVSCVRKRERDMVKKANTINNVWHQTGIYVHFLLLPEK